MFTFPGHEKRRRGKNKEKEKKRIRAHLITSAPHHKQCKYTDTHTHTLITYTTFSITFYRWVKFMIWKGKNKLIHPQGKGSKSSSCLNKKKKLMAPFQILVTSALRICPSVHTERHTQRTARMR